MLTKEDIRNLIVELSAVFVTKEFFIEHLDHKFNQELEPIRDDIRDIKKDLSETKVLVQEISDRDLADSNALKSAYVDHDNRLNVIEKALGINKTKTA